MKKIALWAACLLAALVVVFFVVGTILPGTYSVSRTATIDAPPELVFENVVDLKKTEAWSPWKQADATTKYSYGSKTRGVGASYDWSGEQGTGHLETVAVEPQALVKNRLTNPEMGTTDETFEFETLDGKTRVTWTFAGTAPGIPGAYMALVMDSLLGGFFETGLASLAEVCSKDLNRPEP